MCAWKPAYLWPQFDKLVNDWLMILFVYHYVALAYSAYWCHSSISNRILLNLPIKFIISVDLKLLFYLMAWLPCDLAFVPQKLYNTIGQVASLLKWLNSRPGLWLRPIIYCTTVKQIITDAFIGYLHQGVKIICCHHTTQGCIKKWEL